MIFLPGEEGISTTAFGLERTEVHYHVVCLVLLYNPLPDHANGSLVPQSSAPTGYLNI